MGIKTAKLHTVNEHCQVLQNNTDGGSNRGKSNQPIDTPTHLLEHFSRDKPATWELQGGVGHVSVGQELEQHSPGDTSREPDEAAGLARAHHVTLHQKSSTKIVQS